MNQLFVDNLTVIDFSYLDTQRGILGESWIVDVILEGELDEQGMLFDFGDVKKKVKSIIDYEVDHKLVIPSSHPNLSITTEGTLVEAIFNADSGEQIIHKAPIESLTQIADIEVNKGNVSAYLCEKILQQLPSNVTGINVSLREEIIEGCFYHYSHGLKKHIGNCQRIAHGHRSTINIFKDGEKDSSLEQQWANTFEDIYIGSKEDIVNYPIINDIAHTTFAYTSIQGAFQLTLPSRQVYLIDTDSTVEWIATHIAENLKSKFPKSQFKVKAFEGVGKGAIAQR
ncbi:6-pyruvoyl trahydropterin synthase family protein [Alkalimarinus alittae]|uniref:6-carboxy-5,6,7,8-tetrahydropterin synthase n=1 Tax=Alkalimarinus alittae TaxID=2961619 RepID=A0ABY6MY08_9ALTE|nr:6-carboxytetrahydropterin synthase [Alkalimarinus alittae]UZE94723.1 6-carboxytetrahydropterin synthase [Alkalimarinus alittae]